MSYHQTVSCLLVGGSGGQRGTGMFMWLKRESNWSHMKPTSCCPSIHEREKKERRKSCSSAYFFYQLKNIPPQLHRGPVWKRPDYVTMRALVPLQGSLWYSLCSLMKGGFQWRSHASCGAIEEANYCMENKPYMVFLCVWMHVHTAFL